MVHSADISGESDAVQMETNQYINKEECTVGLTSRMSLRDVPEEEDADASIIARTLVVLLDFLYTACIGM